MGQIDNKKTLILYDFINHKIGGGEMVLSEVLSLYPQADLMALIIDKKTLKTISPNQDIFYYKNIFYYLPKFIKRNPFFILPFIPLEISRWGRVGKKYDRVIAISSAWCHNYTAAGQQDVYKYLFSPPRMIWDQQGGYLVNIEQRSKMTKLLFKIPGFSFLINYFRYKLRLWDFYHNYNQPQHLSAISSTVQKRIHKYYHIKADIIYPFLSVGKYSTNQDNINTKPPNDLIFLKDKKFFLSISVLADYKNIDFIIKSYIKANLDDYLIIAGTGPMQDALRSLIKRHANIVMLGYIDERKKIWLLKHCQAFLFAAKEDFGIAPLEANYFGRPVIAGAKGSMQELISHGQNGYLYKYYDQNSFITALGNFHDHDWDKDAIIKSVSPYRLSLFQDKFTKFTT